MQIKHVKISNFRGIRQMEWSIDNPIVCLIGPGDSTKSTILDAIECVLTPNWNMPFDDCDFYSGDTNNPIEVIVTVGQIPDKLVSEQKFGLYLRGWSKTEGIHDEPVKGDEFVLSIRLRVLAKVEK
jgi:predicted ATP-dependent endonuclease of OLD family